MLASIYHTYGSVMGIVPVAYIPEILRRWIHLFFCGEKCPMVNSWESSRHLLTVWMVWSWLMSTDHGDNHASLRMLLVSKFKYSVLLVWRHQVVTRSYVSWFFWTIGSSSIYTYIYISTINHSEVGVLFQSGLHLHHLVGGWATHLKNMTSSVGMMNFPILFLEN